MGGEVNNAIIVQPLMFDIRDARRFAKLDIVKFGSELIRDRTQLIGGLSKSR